MSEVYGVEVIKSAMKNVCDAVSTIWGVFVEKTGLWNLIGLQGPIKALGALDLAKVKQEFLDMSDAERLDIEALVKAALPAAMLAKIGGVLEFMEKAIGFFERAFVYGKQAYSDGVSLVADFRSLFGI